MPGCVFDIQIKLLHVADKDLEHMTWMIGNTWKWDNNRKKQPYRFFAYMIKWHNCGYHVNRDVCLVFFLFRVCVKKSTQERLALKILIDRPKARNEVRGNAVAAVIDVCCLLFWAASSICFGLSACLLSVFINSCSLSSSFLVHIVVFRCWTVCLAASPCH